MVNDSFLVKLSDRIFKRPLVWILESYLRSIIFFLIAIIFGIPLVQYLQDIVRKIDYAMLVLNSYQWINKNISIRDWISIIVLLLLIVFLRKLYLHISRVGTIHEKFSNESLNKWSIPIGSEWTTQDSDDVTGKILSVTNSYFPGVLKEAYGWYDYEVSFQTKMDGSIKDDEQNFGIMLRSENSSNGVMLQITKKMFQPYLIYNGTFIADSEKAEKLPILLYSDKWIKVKLVVKGDNVDFVIDKSRLQYRIPYERYNVTSGFLSGPTLELKDIKRDSDDNQKKSSKILDELRNAPKNDKGLIEDDAFQQIISKFPSTTPVILEFQKGSVGFRVINSGHVYIRDLLVKKIE